VGTAHQEDQNMSNPSLLAWFSNPWCLLVPFYVLVAAAGLAVPVALIVIAIHFVRLTRAYEQSVRQKGTGLEDRK
jgi:hypothetical protein